MRSLSVKTKIHKVLILLASVFFIFLACDKNNENNEGWKNCTECTIDSWIGKYTGKGDFSNLNNNAEIKDVDVIINIEQTATDYLTIYFQAPSVFTATVSGDFSGPDIVLFAGSGYSVSGTMYLREDELKFTGNSKKFHTESATIVVDQLITFETIKVK